MHALIMTIASTAFIATTSSTPAPSPLYDGQLYLLQAARASVVVQLDGSECSDGNEDGDVHPSGTFLLPAFSCRHVLGQGAPFQARIYYQDPYTSGEIWYERVDRCLPAPAARSSGGSAVGGAGTDDQVARWNGSGLIQGSDWTIDDTGELKCSAGHWHGPSIANPGNSDSGFGRLFFNTAAGKVRLAVMFPTGGASVLATEA